MTKRENKRILWRLALYACVFAMLFSTPVFATDVDPQGSAGNTTTTVQDQGNLPSQGGNAPAGGASKETPSNQDPNSPGAGTGLPGENTQPNGGEEGNADPATNEDNPASAKEGWVTENDENNNPVNRYYYDPDSEAYYMNTQKLIDGVAYTFDKDGNGEKITSTKELIDGVAYDLDEEGRGQIIKSQFCYIDGKKYYADKDGKPVKGWVTYQNRQFYTPEGGVWYTNGMYKIGSSYYYFNQGGQTQMKVIRYVAKPGEKTKAKYYFGEDGKMVTNRIIQATNKRYYFFQSNGKLLVNKTFKLNGNWYYASKYGGAIYTNALKSYNGVMRYYGANGAAYKNRLFTYNGKTYAADQYGTVRKNARVIINGKVYCCSKYHTIQKNYMGRDGSGKLRFFGSNGAQVSDAIITYRGNKYYCQKDGVVRTKSGVITVKGKKYSVIDGGRLYAWGAYNGKKLTRSAGSIMGPSGKETYYNLYMGGIVSIMRARGYSATEYPYWIRSDGAKMLGDYVMVAANLNVRPRGTIVMTSLGPGIVCDTGGFASHNIYQLDLATNW